jgi:hypothetical protein
MTSRGRHGLAPGFVTSPLGIGLSVLYSDPNGSGIPSTTALLTCLSTSFLFRRLLSVLMVGSAEGPGKIRGGG